MKRFLMLLVMAVASLTALAKNDGEVNVKSGDPAVLKNPGTALCTIDYSKAKFNGLPMKTYLKNRGADFVRDWPEDSKKIKTYFTYNFNRGNKKGVQILDEGTKADYKITFKVDDVGTGTVGIHSTYAPGTSSYVSGTVTVTNAKTGAKLCVFEVIGALGGTTYSETARIGCAFMVAAKKITKIVKKAQ